MAALARLVDAIEENGAQHVFLFSMTDAGYQAIAGGQLLGRFPAPPAQPTVALYGDPSTTRTFAFERNGRLYVKQVYLAEYWDLVERHETTTQRTVVYRLERQRAVNLLVANPATREVEIRIDRVRPKDDERLASRALDDFCARLAPALDVAQHLEPVRIWAGFRAMVQARDETFMTVDDAEDPTIRHRLASRRGDTVRLDIRDHAAYDMTQAKYVRETLNIYWLRQEERLHTMMSRVTSSDGRWFGKVYIPAQLDEAALDYVIGRIRSFAPQAS